MPLAHPRRPLVWLLALALALTGVLTAAGPASAAGNGHITGTVTGPNDRPAPAVTVTGYTWQPVSGHWEAFASTSTIGNGSYDLGGLPTDTYRVGFSGRNFYGEGAAFQAEYWDDAVSVDTAQDIEVWSGAVYPHRDAELSEAGGPPIANTSLPVISGTERVGSTLTASTGTWDPATGLTLGYEWLVGGTVAATGASYTPTNYVGETIRVRVTASKDGYRPRTVTSEPTAALADGPAPVFQTQPAISGAARVGAEVTATPGTWTYGGGPVNRQWIVDDSVVSSGLSYTPVAADAGKSLRVRVTAFTPWVTATTATSASVSVLPGALTNTKRPRVTGTPRVTHKLVAKPGSWTPGASSFTYQWLRDGKVIRSARHYTYKLPRSAKGHRFSVRVTARRAGYTSLTATSSRAVKIS